MSLRDRVLTNFGRAVIGLHPPTKPAIAGTNDALARAMFVLRLFALPVALLVCTSCREPPLNTPVPDLINSQPSNKVALATFSPGERMRWSVHWRGFKVGRLELSVDGGQTRSLSLNLIQNRLSRKLRRARIKLSATIRDGVPLEAAERIQLKGSSTRAMQRFEGNAVHWSRNGRRGTKRAPALVHGALSALGVMRGKELPRQLYVAANNSLYALAMSVPSRESDGDNALIRIDAEAREHGKRKVVALISIWISDDELRIPVRVDVSVGSHRLVATRLR